MIQKGVTRDSRRMQHQHSDMESVTIAHEDSSSEYTDHEPETNVLVQGGNRSRLVSGLACLVVVCMLSVMFAAVMLR